jgi:hypothetical protein
VLLVLVLCGVAPAAAGESDPLYYEVEEGSRIVFTNTPSTEARPVPGMEPRRGAPRATPGRTPALPATVYDPFIERVAHENGLSPALIKAVALVESGFDPTAVSPKGAQGLMQLMPGTARDYGVDDPLDPLQNLQAGAGHLRHLLDEFDGNLTLALAAYNAGAGAVRRHGGVPDYAETREYVRRVHAKLGRADGAPARTADGQPRSRPAPAVRLVLQPDGSVLLAN